MSLRHRKAQPGQSSGTTRYDAFTNGLIPCVETATERAIVVRPILLLTSPAARSALRNLVARELPHLWVAAYEDLTTYTNIQLVARITAS